MVAYLTRRALGTGMVVASVTCLVAYFLRADISGSGALGADRLGLAAGLAIAALQLGLAPFYVRNAFVPMAVIVGGAGGVLVWHVLRMGGYIDPVDLAVWQVRLVAAMASLTWLVDGWWLLRTGRPARPSGAGP